MVAETGALWHSEAKSVAAVELLALVAHHPSSEQEARDRATSLLVQIASRLDSEVIAQAEERGRARKLEEVAAEILRGG